MRALYHAYVTGPILGGLWGFVIAVTVSITMSFATGEPFRPSLVLALLWGAVIGAAVVHSRAAVGAALLLVVAAGLLVGVGTRIANGCTSGHGVCGISRLSLRGMVATVFYILAGGISVVVFRHILGVI